MASSPPNLTPWTLAETIDRALSHRLSRELGRGEAEDLSILLGTAFPPLLPRLPWQFDALRELSQEGWRTERLRPLIQARLFAAAGDLQNPEGVLRGLRRAAWAERARIALRELLPLKLGGADIRTTARELSALADACFEVALAEARGYVEHRFGPALRSNGTPSGFVVFGMGKLGGFELNAGSDVDVVFFYDTDDGGSQLDLHEHWARVARRLVHSIDAVTEDGMVWRVDLRLRPEGSQGALVNSIAAAERYYETWGRLWERSALVRARPIAGDFTLGQQLQHEIISPFVYQRKVEPAIATALAELVQRSRAELSPDPARDLKLGPGGIREAEFFIQALQLIWGGREASLRVAGSLPALGRLHARGLVSDLEQREITAAYSLLRRVEHRVQWMSGLQTHLLPTQAEELERLARSLRFSHPAQLLEELGAARSAVAELFASLSPSVPRPPSRYQALLSSFEQTKLDADRIAEQLFGHPEIGDHLRALGSRPDGLLGTLSRERYPELSDQVLDAIAECADPEQAARFLRLFFARFLSPAPYIAALSRNAQALRRLVTVLGASAFVGDAVVTMPELADIILFGGASVEPPRSVVETELYEAARGQGRNPDYYERRERFLAGTRRAKQRVMVEVAVADLGDVIGTRQATRLLSDLADIELDEAVRFERGEGARGLSVIAVGKLGGREIGYGSDLDVLFIYDPAAAPRGSDPGEFFARTAQRIIRLISEPHPAGKGYELDTRLRPSGASGMLVTSLEAFARYHGVGPARVSAGPAVFSSGAAWEKQALLRARVAAGDLELGEKVVAVAERAAYEGGAPPVAEMHRLRIRMQTELGQEKPAYFDLKLGYGGLLDIEFAVQWLQMRYGRDPSIRTQDTGNALEALHDAGYLLRAHYEVFRDGYAFLRRLEQRIHVGQGAGSSSIDVRLKGLTQLARRMGFQDTLTTSAGVQLMQRYIEVTNEVRETYYAVLGMSPPKQNSGAERVLFLGF